MIGCAARRNENWYSTLIQPLNDLAQSFDVDISDCLSEYLEALDLDVANTNFAEAALVIQGSTQVFGKKVDFLHQLVLETLENISSGQAKMHLANSKTSLEVSSSASSFFSQFESSALLLDDVIAKHCYQGKIVNLPYTKRRVPRCRGAQGGGGASVTRTVDTSRDSAVIMQAALEQSGKTSIKLNRSSIDCYTGALLIVSSESFRSDGALSVINSVAGKAPEVFEMAQDDHSEPAYYAPPFASTPTADLMNISMSPIDMVLSVQKREQQAQQHANPSVKINRETSLLTQDPHQVKGVSRKLKVNTAKLLPRFDPKTESRCSDELLPSLGLNNVAAFAHIMDEQRNSRRNHSKSTIHLESQHETGVIQYDYSIKGGPVDDRSGPGDPSSMDERDDYDDADPTSHYHFFEGSVDMDLSADAQLDDKLEFSETPEDANSYEDICRAHLEAFIKDAQVFAKDTLLSARVSEWTKKLEPILAAQDKARTFDIHVYCKNTMSEVRRAQRPVESVKLPSVRFSEVVRGRDSAEVGRVFLSCLQLVNAGELEMDARDDGQVGAPLVFGDHLFLRVVSG